MFRIPLLATCLAASVVVQAQALQLVSRAADGGFGNGTSICYGNSVSSDGRYVVFESTATNLVKDDTNQIADVFLRDVRKGTTERISVGPDGLQANGASIRPSISSDGRFVVFWSFASNLVQGDDNDKWDVYLRDLRSGTTERISLTKVGDKNPDIPPSISRNGRFIVWGSEAPDLTEGDTNQASDIFLRDREKGTTEMVSVSEKGEIGNGSSIQPFISDDGSTIAFRTAASNLVPGDENKSWDILVRDRSRKTMQCATLTYKGSFGDKNRDSEANFPPSLSSDGRYLAFESFAADLVPNDTGGRRDVFVRDLKAGITLRISVGLGGAQANGDSAYPSLSADGRLVAFESHATNLVGGDVNQRPDIFLCDLRTGSILLVSADSTGIQGNQSSVTTRLSGDGKWLVFSLGVLKPLTWRPKRNQRRVHP